MDAWRFGIVWSSALAALLTLSADALSLSCARPSNSIEEAYDASDSIIIGVVNQCEVLQSREVWVQGGEGCSFSTLEVLKDSASPRDYTGIVDSSACGLSVRVGEQYLLFLDAENRPLQFSEHLPGEPTTTGKLEARIDLLRRYRNGQAEELAEPWLFRETFTEACSLQHLSGYANRIAFERRPPHATPLADLDWEGMEMNGMPMFRPEQIDEMRLQFAAMPPQPADPAHRLEVSFPEREPVAPRNVTLRVDKQVWTLERETVELPEHVRSPIAYRYVLRGGAALEVLSAMELPADVVVTATLVAPAEPAVAPPAVGVSNGFAAIEVDQTGFAGAVTQGDRQQQVRRVRQPPEPTIGFKVRSTNIIGALEQYRACNAPR